MTNTNSGLSEQSLPMFNKGRDTCRRRLGRLPPTIALGLVSHALLKDIKIRARGIVPRITGGN